MTRFLFALSLMGCLGFSIVATNPIVAVDGATMQAGRVRHTASLLFDGSVLVLGGGDGGAIGTCERYYPTTGRWTTAATPTIERFRHTATVLPTGQVLFIGGITSGVYADSYTAECALYDPATDTWHWAQPLHQPRAGHTATLLPNGRVLVAGGINSAGTVSACEIWDGHWSPVANLLYGRVEHTATLLPSGKVLVAGGNGPIDPAICEEFDPSTGAWYLTGSMGSPRYGHTATALPSGGVLVTGGNNWNSVSYGLVSSEIYDPGNRSWNSTGDLATPRSGHSASLLATGKILVAGGGNGTVGALDTMEIYDPTSGQWSAGGHLTQPRMQPSATLLPFGELLVIGGSSNFINGSGLASYERYVPAPPLLSNAPTLPLATGQHGATPLIDGRILVIGGIGVGVGVECALYSLDSNQWLATGSTQVVRIQSSTTLLPSGKVLVTGGYGLDDEATCELFDPTNETWSSTGTMAGARRTHQAVLLPSGDVLVIGGYHTTDGALNTCEIYESASGQWRPTGSLSSPRHAYASILLPNGKVMVMGGIDQFSTILTTCELFDPATEQWTTCAPMSTARSSFTATLQPSGQVLVCGGMGLGPTAYATTERYDSTSDRWSTGPSMATARCAHSAIALPSGHILVSAGTTGATLLSSCELFTPATDMWTTVGNLGEPRIAHASSLLPSGEVLISGGDNYGPLATCYRFDARGYTTHSAPSITTASVLGQSTVVRLDGSGFRPTIDTGDGSAKTSNTGIGEIQLLRIDNGQTIWLPSYVNIPASDAVCAGMVPTRMLNGPVQVRLFVNGTASRSVSAVIADHVVLDARDHVVIYDGIPHAIDVTMAPALAPGSSRLDEFRIYDKDPAQGGKPVYLLSGAPVDVGYYQQQSRITGSQSGEITAILRIAPRPLGITVTNATRAFAQPNPVWSGVVSGAIAADGLTVTYSSSTLPSSPVGTYSIHALISDPFVRLTNYTVTNQPGTLTIGAASVGIDFATNHVLVVTYDGNPHAITPVFTPALDGGSAATVTYRSWSGNPTDGTTVPTPGSAWTVIPPSAAGWYRVEIMVSGNLAGSLSGALHIQQAPLLVQADDVSRMAGASDPLFTGTVTGLISSDGISVSYSSSATPTSPAGNYPIIATLSDPHGKLGNYQVTLSSGVLTITTESTSSSPGTSSNRCGQGIVAGLFLLLSAFLALSYSRQWRS